MPLRRSWVRLITPSTTTTLSPFFTALLTVLNVLHDVQHEAGDPVVRINAASRNYTRVAALPLSTGPPCALPTMATRTMQQPSEYEIQREVEALRDIRRRSTTPGALTIDPDLPNQVSPTSPTGGYWSGAPAGSSSFTSVDGDSSSSTHGDASSSSDRSSATGGSSTGESSTNPNNPADDPFHLFWVPASLHPEIAPAEFRAFLKEHARSPPPADGSPALERSNSASSNYSTSSGLDRKKSMLSRQYRPSENDGVEDEKVVPLRRNRSSMYTNRGPQLTIGDLQKLEELAEEAQESDDPSRLRNVLRRSLSLNVSPTGMDIYNMSNLMFTVL